MNMYGRILYYGIGLNTSHRRTSGRDDKSEGDGLGGGTKDVLIYDRKISSG